MSATRITVMVIGMIGALVALAFEDARVPVGLPALGMIAAAAGLFEREVR